MTAARDGDPTPLTILHGFTETPDPWRSSFPRARCPALPGHGWRPCAESLSMASLAGELARRGEHGDLVGYSLGGRIALRWALDHPTTVRRLVLISSSPGIADADARAQRLAADGRLAQMLDEDGIGPFVAHWETQRVLAPARPLTRDQAARLRSMRLSHDPRGLAGSLRTLGAGAMEPLWDRLGGLHRPTLLIVGACDGPYLALMGAMAQRLPDVRLAIVPDAGHAVHREQPEILRRLVGDFLGPG